MNELSFVIGVDFGTDSVRSVLVNAGNGEEIAASVFYYPRWKQGLYCDAAANRFRQHPLDYIEGLQATIRECVDKAGPGIASRVKGIAVDTTGSTPVAVNDRGIPLALLPEFADNPNAMFVLWKDHTSIREAAELNEHAKKFDTNYLQFVGGIYSSEWYWAKLLHILREDEAVRRHCYAWVEHCDWVPFLLTHEPASTGDVAIKRGVCSAGHKSLWSPEFGGLPPDSFFSSWDGLLAGYSERLFTNVCTADKPVGTLTASWARQLGLSQDVVVGSGAFDCHMGAVGGQIEPYHLSKVMGTSTCDMLVAPMEEVKGKLVKGICGQVPGSIIPGMMGMEAGQSAFGDAYAWFRNLITWPLQQAGALISDTAREKIQDTVLQQLTEAAAALPVEADTEIALDWFNGRRTPDANQLLKGAIMGIDLATDAPRMFRAVAEATCFGARTIVDRFRGEGIPVIGVIGLGGVARKSPYIMQMMADVLDMPIRIHKSEQSCALGAAMFAATAAGIYVRVEDAMKAMGPGFDREYQPDTAKVAVYRQKFDAYAKLGAFIEQQTIL